MDERDEETVAASLQEEEESVRRLLEMAGPRPLIPQEDLDAVSNAARSAWQTQVRRRAEAAAPRPERPFRALWMGLAAALAVAAGLAWWWLSRSGGAPPTVAWVEAVAGSVYVEEGTKAPRGIVKGEPISDGAVLRNDSGDEARASLRLAGGATVRLDVATRVRFVSAAALELERGGLYVDTGSRPRPRMAIEIRTPAGTVRDIGTQFAVRIDPKGTALLVRVRDGAIVAEHQGRTYLTHEGQELILRRDGTSQRREIAGHGAEWEWVLQAAPGFDIEGRSLGQFLDWVSRETGWRVRYADEGLQASAAGIVLHGSLGALRPDRAPFAILPGAGLEGRLEGGELIVRRLR